MEERRQPDEAEDTDAGQHDRRGWLARVLSARAAFGWACLLMYGPLAWVPFVSESRWDWIKLLPLLPGMVPAYLVQASFRSLPIAVAGGQWMRMGLAASLTFALIVLWTALIYRFPRWRWLVAVLALMVSGISSWGLYAMYKA